MNSALQSPFVQIALPIIVTLAIAAFVNNKAFDGVHKGFDGIYKALDGVYKAIDGTNRRLDDIVARLGRIEVKLEDHADRIARLEERTSPIQSR